MDNTLLFLAFWKILKKRKNRRSKYISTIYRTRFNQGDLFLLPALREDNKAHEQYFRMSKQMFDYILHKIEARMEHQKTHLIPISATERLALTLRYLTSGNSMRDVGVSYRISPQSVSTILRETLDAIILKLETEALPQPTTADFVRIAEEFNTLWNFPHCCGSVDGKHVRVVAPRKTGSHYFNYKNYFSVVLLAVTDARKRFIMVDIGSQGSRSDAGILQNSPINTFIKNETGILPPPKPLINGVMCPYVFLGDEGFGLGNHLMRPYGGNTLSPSEKTFNYRLSRARLVVENTFGILSSRFRVYHTPIKADVELVKKIIYVTVILHNILTPHSTNIAVSKTSLIEIDNTPAQTRNVLKDYFMTDGRIPWQDKQALGFC